MISLHSLNVADTSATPLLHHPRWSTRMVTLATTPLLHHPRLSKRMTFLATTPLLHHRRWPARTAALAISPPTCLSTRMVGLAITPITHRSSVMRNPKLSCLLCRSLWTPSAASSRADPSPSPACSSSPPCPRKPPHVVVCLWNSRSAVTKALDICELSRRRRCLSAERRMGGRAFPLTRSQSVMHAFSFQAQ